MTESGTNVPYVVLSRDACVPVNVYPIPSGYRSEVWHASLFSIRPQGRPFRIRDAAWWFYYVLAGRHKKLFAVLCFDSLGEIAHTSFACPANFKFAFMHRDDLQISGIWTHPDHRRKGLARCAVSELIQHAQGAGFTLWYVAAARNIPSIHLAMQNGFVKAGRARKAKRLGTRILAVFRFVDHRECLEQ